LLLSAKGFLDFGFGFGAEARGLKDFEEACAGFDCLF
jgi:hypothetical protein